MAEPAQALPVARVHPHRSVVVDAPDVVAATGLADRLRAYSPLLSSNGDGCRLTVPSIGDADAVRTVLATVETWAEHWQLAEVPVSVDGRRYTLEPHPTLRRRPAAAPRPDRPRPVLVFFHSPRSGQCRRAEALVAQVLQRRRNHETFELVRVSVDERPDLAERLGVDEVPAVLVIEHHEVVARLGSLRHSHEIEQALRPWLR